MNCGVIVFSDLDGSLLDHETYGYAAARPALVALQERAIPLVLCTSKTAAEILLLRADPLLADCPAIVENGSGVLDTGATIPQPGPSHARLLSIVQALPEELRERFSGFSSWDSDTLQRHTGLRGKALLAAGRRDYTEPGIWLGDEVDRRRFVAALETHGLYAQQGGRFLTIGFGANKVDRMREMIETVERRQSRPVVSIALGDAPNDLDMLQLADYGVIVPNPAHAGIPPLAGEAQGRIIRAPQAGPAGWSESLLTLLDKPTIAQPGT